MTAIAHPHRTRVGWLLPLGAGRVVAWQVAVLAVLATGFRVTPVAVTVMALAGLLVVVTSVRVGGLCGYQWVVVFARFVLRRKRSPASAPTPVHTVATGLMAPAKNWSCTSSKPLRRDDGGACSRTCASGVCT